MRIGVFYPFNLNAGYDRTEAEYIKSGIRAWLDIGFYELFHKPFGVDLDILLFDSMDSAFLDRVELTIAESLAGFSPIQLNLIQFDLDDSKSNSLLVHLFYTIVSTGQQDTYTYLLDKEN